MLFIMPILMGVIPVVFSVSEQNQHPISQTQQIFLISLKPATLNLLRIFVAFGSLHVGFSHIRPLQFT
jgi:hypothetical protein